jgi:hypothetical protein
MTTTYQDREAAKEHLVAEGFVRVPAPNGQMIYFKGDQLAKVIVPPVPVSSFNNTTIAYQTLDAAKIATVQAMLAAK